MAFTSTQCVGSFFCLKHEDYMKTQKVIAVIGLGYVGLPLALLAERRGYSVVGVDTDEKK
ncbi:TPA: hypothetical protein DEP58_04175 [Patescibacteria group bacterium]|nr:MAG: UDP-GlcNAc dehydrogenase [Parcubacteria group bacterium GW2011_GWD2_42_14]HCC05471.1 hypothetical protein [Patescibacteria group bacterium]